MVAGSGWHRPAGHRVVRGAAYLLVFLGRSVVVEGLLWLGPCYHPAASARPRPATFRLAGDKDLTRAVLTTSWYQGRSPCVDLAGRLLVPERPVGPCLSGLAVSWSPSPLLRGCMGRALHAALGVAWCGPSPGQGRRAALLPAWYHPATLVPYHAMLWYYQVGWYHAARVRGDVVQV